MKLLSKQNLKLVSTHSENHENKSRDCAGNGEARRKRIHQVHLDDWSTRLQNFEVRLAKSKRTSRCRQQEPQATFSEPLPGDQPSVPLITMFRRHVLLFVALSSSETRQVCSCAVFEISPTLFFTHRSRRKIIASARLTMSLTIKAFQMLGFLKPFPAMFSARRLPHCLHSYRRGEARSGCIDADFRN